MAPEDTADRSLSRRGALQTGALAAAALAAGLPGVRGAVQDADALARIYASDFHPNAAFRVVSEPLAYEPEVTVQEGEAFLADLYWDGYETRIVQYENTHERVLLFPPTSAGVERGGNYRMGEIRSTDQLADGVVGVTFA